jgi:hypothetical protein
MEPGSQNPSRFDRLRYALWDLTVNHPFG